MNLAHSLVPARPRVVLVCGEARKLSGSSGILMAWPALWWIPGMSIGSCRVLHTDLFALQECSGMIRRRWSQDVGGGACS